MTQETISSETIFEGRVFDLRTDRIRLPDSRETTLDIVVHGGAVVILPIDSSGRVWFVRQHRQATGGELLELPAGTREAAEEPAITARRECREEIGMAPGNLEHLGGFYLAPGYSTEYVYVFLATRLEEDPLAPDPDEMIEIVRLSLPEAGERLRAGDIPDAKTLAAFYLAGSKLDQFS